MIKMAFLFITAVCFTTVFGAQGTHVFWYKAIDRGYNLQANPGPNVPAGAYIYQGNQMSAGVAQHSGNATDGFFCGSGLDDAQGRCGVMWSKDLCSSYGSVTSAKLRGEYRDCEGCCNPGPIAIRCGVVDFRGNIDIWGSEDLVAETATWQDFLNPLGSTMGYDMMNPTMEAEETINYTAVAGRPGYDSSVLDKQFGEIDITDQVNWILAHTGVNKGSYSGQYAIAFLVTPGLGSTGKINLYADEAASGAQTAYGSDHPWTPDGNTLHIYAVGNISGVPFSNCPNPPVLVPLSGPTFNRRPLFKWLRNSVITTYQLLVSYQSDFTNPLISLPVADTFYQTQVNLGFGTVYWKVGDFDAPGCWSGASSVVILDSLQPQITLSPASLSATLRTGDSVSRVLTLSNPGRAILNFSITGPSAGSWLSKRCDSTRVPPGGSVPVTVKFNAANMTVSGLFVDSLLITHNVYNRPSPLSVRCSLRVRSTVPAIIPVFPDPTPLRRPRFSWHPVDSTGYYVIQINTSRDFSYPFISQPLSDTFYTPLADLPVGRIYWRVRSDLSAQFSAIDSFLIQTDSIPLLVPVKPETLIVRRPALRWHRARGALTYKVQVDTSGRFTSPVVTVPVSDTFFLPPANLPLGRICWRVSNIEYNEFKYSVTDTFFIAPSAAGEGAQAGAALVSYDLEQNCPNPFNPRTAINFSVPGRLQRMSIRIYDLKGKLVRALVDGPMPGGRHQIEFDGRADGGGVLTSGVYVCIMKAPGFQKSVKMFMMK